MEATEERERRLVKEEASAKRRRAGGDEASVSGNQVTEFVSTLAVLHKGGEAQNNGLQSPLSESVSKTGAQPKWTVARHQPATI